MNNNKANNVRENMYDIIFFTNQPAFYKIKLYNAISKKRKILVIFMGEASVERTKDFVEGKIEFEYIFLNKGNYEKRNIIYSCMKLLKLLFKIKYKTIITMGWSSIEDFLIVTFSNKNKNGIVCETSIYETQLDNWKRIFKKYILSRINYAFVSGKPHSEIFKRLGFKGKIIITNGVGLYNRNIESIDRKKKKEYKYLCVARLIPVKNLEFLIEVFNKNSKKLSIVGTGILESKLKKMSKENITFYGAIENKKMNNIYKEHDILILPSYSEPWGLVVEEAISNGMPVIVSDKVGCNIDIVKDLETGEIFKFDDVEELNIKIKIMEKEYEKYVENILKIDFREIEKKQINSYVNIN